MSNLLVKELKRSKYRLLGLVGQGQFGRVYCASHRKTGRLFALKELDKQRFPTNKFLRELRFLLSLQHANIVTCHALEHTATGRYLVMDYCEGGTLRSLMEDDVRLHPAQCLKLVIDVLAGLAHAHSREIVHCDIKPENILLTLEPEGWTARISDFGIARLSQEMTTDGLGNTGSPAYMAPERFYGQYSNSSDIYAVGILLFELLAGHRPFSGAPADLMSAHLNQPVKIPASIPEPLQPLILKALQKLPARRFRSASEMLEAISSAANSLDYKTIFPIGRSQLLLPTLHTSACDFVPLRQEVLVAAVQQLSGISASEELLPEQGSPFVIPPDPDQGERILQVFGSRIGCQIYPQGVLNSETDSQFNPDLPPVIVRLPEPIRQLCLRPQGCFAITQHSIYLVPQGLFQRGMAQHGQKRLQQPDQTATQHLVPQLVAEFHQEFGATIAPSGRWLASAEQQTNRNSQVSIWHLPATQSYSYGVLPGAVVHIKRPSSHLLQIVALDSRHFATFSHLVDPQTNSCIIGVSMEVFTRRGGIIGSFTLPSPLRSVFPTATPYRLLAMEPGHPTSVLLIDLKPLRTQRLGTNIRPSLIAEAPWGLVLMAKDGKIALLDQYGQAMGQINGPPHPTAIAVVNGYGLLIATWNNGEGMLYTTDLRQMELDILF